MILLSWRSRRARQERQFWSKVTEQNRNVRNKEVSFANEAKNFRRTRISARGHPELSFKQSAYEAEATATKTTSRCEQRRSRPTSQSVHAYATRRRDLRLRFVTVDLLCLSCYSTSRFKRCFERFMKWKRVRNRVLACQLVNYYVFLSSAPVRVLHVWLMRLPFWLQRFFQSGSLSRFLTE